MSLKRAFRRLALPVGVMLLGTGAVFAMNIANAAVIGKLSIDPASGSDTSAISVTTSAACPADPNDTNLVAFIDGAGFPTNTFVVGNSQQSIYPTVASGGMTIPLAAQLVTTGNLQTPAVVFTGTYTITVRCQDLFGGTQFGDFTNTITFAADHPSYTAASTAVNTSTSLTPTPASPQNAGTSVSLSSTVTPAAAGTIKFFDGAT